MQGKTECMGESEENKGSVLFEADIKEIGT
jgi:hypothetical protein